MESIKLKGNKRRGKQKAQEWWRGGEREGVYNGREGRDVGRRHSDVIKVAELKGCTLHHPQASTHGKFMSL